MKIACDKCLKVEDKDRIKDWLRVRTDNSEYILCPDCADGFWMAIDHKLPSIVPEEQVIFMPNGYEKEQYKKIKDDVKAIFEKTDKDFLKKISEKNSLHSFI